MELVHAQHLVIRPVSGAIESHLATPEPSKALVLSFHGPTGVGKNFVSGIIADNLFKAKRESKFVHTIIGPHHFPHSFSQKAYSVSITLNSTQVALLWYDDSMAHTILISNGQYLLLEFCVSSLTL